MISYPRSLCRFDPYDDPDDTQTRRQRKPKQSQSRDGFAPRDSKTSGNGIYETPADPKPKKKKPAKNDDDDDEDSLVEMVNFENTLITLFSKFFEHIMMIMSEFKILSYLSP